MNELARDGLAQGSPNKRERLFLFPIVSVLGAPRTHTHTQGDTLLRESSQGISHIGSNTLQLCTSQTDMEVCQWSGTFSKDKLSF